MARPLPDKFGSTYSATKQEIIKENIEENAANGAVATDALDALRAAGAGAGLGHGTISGETTGTTITGVGTFFVNDLTVADTVFIAGTNIEVVVASITDATHFEATLAPSADFVDQQFAYNA